MSKLNLDLAEDFAIATMDADALALLNAFTRNRSEWNITEGSYKGGRKGAKKVLFHVFQSKSVYQAGLSSVTDNSGRRLSKYSFPYVDGQATDDLGSKGENFDMEIVIYGPAYKAGYNALMREFNDPMPGTLEHPVRGIIRAKAEDWVGLHSHEAFNAVGLRVRFTQHSFDSGAFSEVLVAASPKSALQNMIAYLQKISAVIAAVRQINSIITQAILTVREKVQAFYTAYQTLAADMASANGLTGADIAAILPINIGGVIAVSAGGRTAGGVDQTVDPGSFGANASTSVSANSAGLSITVGGFVKVSNRYTTIIQPADPFANLPLALLGDVAREAIEQTQLALRVEQMRAAVNELSADIDAVMATLALTPVGNSGTAAAAANTMLDSKVTLLQSLDAMGSMLQAGQASGRPQIINYKAPHDMSIREAAFLNGLTPQDGADISVLNPALESVNLIPKGTILLVPVLG